MRGFGVSVWFMLLAACGGEDLTIETAQTEDAVLDTSERRPPQGLWLRGGTLPDSLVINTSSARDSAGRTYSSLDTNYGVLSGSQGSWQYRNFRWTYVLTLRSGTDFIGTTFEGYAGATYDFRIKNVRAPAAPYSGTVYEVEYRLRGWTSWYLLCGTTPSDNESIPVQGSWSSSGLHTTSTGNFTFACRNGVIYKAISWGYEPWRSLNHFHAATRAGRADYCGNGRSFTMPGTPIEIFDRAGLRSEVSPPIAPAFLFEAGWAADGANTGRGAVCLSKFRWEQLRPDPSIPASPTEPGGCPSLPDPRNSPNVRYCDSMQDGYPRPIDYDYMTSRGAIVFTKSYPY